MVLFFAVVSTPRWFRLRSTTARRRCLSEVEGSEVKGSRVESSEVEGDKVEGSNLFGIIHYCPIKNFFQTFHPNKILID
jgi:hypothetical protein